jgi:hypothetical protein
MQSSPSLSLRHHRRAREAYRTGQQWAATVIELEQFFNNLAHTLSVRLNEIITTLRTPPALGLEMLLMSDDIYNDSHLHYIALRDARMRRIFYG